MFDYEFSEKVQLLIEGKTETEIVDFKQEWHESNSELMKHVRLSE